MTMQRRSDGDAAIVEPSSSNHRRQLSLELQPPLDSRRDSLLRWASVASLRNKRFSYLDSTENYHSVEGTAVYGPFAHLRKILLKSDSYKNYSRQRQWLQDAIVEDLLDQGNSNNTDICITPTEPWLIFTVGARGAGKYHTIQELVRAGHLPLLSFVYVDPDSIRRRLPEFGAYSRHEPDHVNDLMRKESSFLAELLLVAALQNSRNVIFDSSMRNPVWFLYLFGLLRKTFAQEAFGLLTVPKIALLYISAPQHVILQRAEKKSKETGRMIHQDSILNSLETIPASLEAVRPSVDFFCQIENGETACTIVDGNVSSWEEFHANFLQTCAWKPGMKKGRQQRLERTMSSRETTDANESVIRRARELHNPFSVLISSEENNKSNHMRFFGKYSHIRKTLDYEYHCNYTFERQKLQDAIISDMIDEAVILDMNGNAGTVPTQPWIVFTAGAMGSGKGHTMNVLVKKGRFPLYQFVVVDPDEIRRLLPEFHVYVKENPELAGELTHKEAGFIAEILTLAALQGGKNVLQDGSLRDCDWYQIYFSRLRREFPLVRQAIIHVTAPKEAVFERAAHRARMTGRVVPRKLLEAAMEQVPRSVAKLSSLVDYYAKINNPPYSEDVELIEPNGSSWAVFSRQWIQTVAYADDRSKVMEKAANSRHRLEQSKSLMESDSNG